MGRQRLRDEPSVPKGPFWGILARMALIIPSGYAAFVLHWESVNFDSGRAVTTFGWGEEIGPDPQSLQTAATIVRQQTIADILPLMDSSTRLLEVEAYNEVDGVTVVAGNNGGTTYVSQPPNVALLVRKVVSGRGRRRQGRMFWPSILAQPVVGEDGALTTGARNDLQGAFSDWYTELGLQLNGQMVILQNEEGSTPPISPPPPVVSLSVEPKVASQRRRLRR